MERDKIYQQLGLEENAGLFIRSLQTDALAKQVILHFLHEQGVYDQPNLTYFRIVLKECRQLKLEIEDDGEEDTRPLWLQGTHDILDITLGEAKFLKKFVLFAGLFSLEFSYNEISIELESE